MRNAGSNSSNPVTQVDARMMAVSRSRFAFITLSFLAFFAFSGAVSAQTNIYEMRGSTNYGIYVYNTTTGVTSTVYRPYPVTPAATNSATLAQRPSDGMLFYVTYTGANNPQMYRFNPATPNVAPVPVGTGLGGAVPSSLRMAFSPGGTLYYLPDSRVLYTINPATGVATPGITVGAAITSGGDMAFDASSTLYVVTSAKALYTVNIGSGAVTQLGNAIINFPNPDPNATIGLAFDSAGRLLTQTQNANNIYSIGLPVAGGTAPVGTLVTAGDGDISSTGDMASANVPAPNLSITKTDGVTTVYRGGPVTYTIVVTNNGTYTVTGTVADTVPATVTGVTWTCVASAGSFCAAASGSGNAINTSATLEAGDTATYTVSGTITAGASGTLTNTATVALPAWLIDSAIGNNTASDSDTINLNANLGITKTDGLANVNPGSAITYTIVVSNAGPDTSNGSIVTDTVPATITGVTWTCGSPIGGATCGAASGSGNSINTTANLPSGGSVTYTVSGTLATTATGTLSNTARVVTPAAGVTDPNDPTRTGAANNSATDTTTINTVPDLLIAKTHVGNFTVGVNGTYTLTANNAGAGPTSGTITVTDNLPAGLTVAATPTGTGWNCSTTVVGSSTATCTSSTVIGAGATSPNPITLTVVVSPAAFAASPVTNVANISGGNEPAFNNGNNSDTDPTNINGVPDLTIAKSHTGNFTVGVNGTYTLTASNPGTLATSGTITVTDNLPTGLTVAAIPTGTGWNCSTTVVGSSTATCTSSTVIGAGVTSPNPITLTVVVGPAAFAASPVTNVANVSGGGEPAYNNGNNSVNDATTIIGVADLTIAKSHSGNFTVGVNGTYTLTASNPGTLATSGTITVTDTLPTGLTVASIPTGTGWNCATTVVGSSTATCTSITVIGAGATSPNPITLTVVVSPAAFAASPVTNVANISGGGEPAYNNGNNSASDPTTIIGVADLRIAKTHAGNFTVGVNGTYTLTASNSGTFATSGTITVTDNLPTGLTVAAIPTGIGWNCSTTVLGSSTATCTSSTVIGAGATSPNPITLIVVVSPAAFAASPVTNVANISGGGEPAYNNGNNSASDPTTIIGVADLTIAKSHTGNFTVGVNGTYTLTASNPGTLATSGTITVTDNLPTGLTVAAIPTGTGWNCATTVVGSSTATCTSSTVIGAGATSPNPITLIVVVSPAAFAASPVTNVANISGGGEPAYNNGNNSVNDATTINGVADLRIAKSHAGNFTVGVNGTYTLTASNAGTLATSGTITVTDNLPTGLTVAAIPTGTGWNCATTVVGSSTATCTSSTVIGAGATSPNPITLTVVVGPAAFAASPVTNVANISGGGEPAYNNGNNSVNDPTTIIGVADLIIAKSHSGNFTVGVNGTYTLTASNPGTLATSGTITVTDNLPAGLTVAAIPTGTGWNCSTTVVGSSTATCTSSTVIAAGATSPNPITLTVVVSPAAFAASPVTNVANISGGGEPAYNNGNNSVNDPTTIIGVADLTIAKSHSGNFTVGVNGTYTLTASNSGTLATSGTITVTDNLPTGLTVAAIPTGTGWNCATTVVGSSTATCTSSTAIGAGATSPNPITLTVVVSPAAFAASPVTNAANISGGGEPAYNNGNNSVNDATTINGVADLRIAKSHAGNFTVGVNGSYTLTASNSGTLATSGTITVTDNLPTGLNVAAIPTGTGWNCSTTIVGSSTATCTSSTVIGAGATSPNPITLTVVVGPAAFAASPVTNVANISGGSEPAYNNGNNSASDPTIINGVSDVRIAKSHTGNFTVGVNGTYTLTASNPGTLATSGTITVTDNLPTGLTVAAIPTGTGWNCSTTVIGSNTATCTSSTVIGAGATSPNPITLTVVVSPAAFAASPVTNVANISGGGEPAYNNGNNSASDPTTINGVSDVRIAKSHTGNFTVGVNGTYTLTASNSGTLATSGTITVTDNLPTGLTVAAIPTGTGWNCSTTVVGSSTATCTSSTVIGAGATSPNPITLTVVVSPAAFAASPVTNVVNISGGGEPAYNNGNNSASDPTTINGAPDLTVTKTHTGNFTQGQTGATYSITTTNSGTAPTSGTVTVTDSIPAGLSATNISGTGWSCILGTLTCTRNDALAPGASYPVITLTVNVSLSAPASVTNSATVSGGGENNISNNTANDLTTINAAAPPNISLVKSVSPGGTQMPGTDLLYSIVYSNTGGQPANNFVIVDPNMANVVPAERAFLNVDFKVGSLTSSPGSTGLVATFGYSNDGGTTWAYTPVSGGGGAPAGYDRLVTNVRWTFTGSLSQTAPNNTGSVGLTVRIR